MLILIEKMIQADFLEIATAIEEENSSVPKPDTENEELVPLIVALVRLGRMQVFGKLIELTQRLLCKNIRIFHFDIRRNLSKS